MMYAARILYPVKTLGPGDRVGIWLCGCSHGCPGCSNPELWSCGEQFRITRERLLQLVGSIAQGAEVNGFTITGGDPLEQSEELALLLPELRKISGDILVYTGYTLEQLRAMDSPAVESVDGNEDGSAEIERSILNFIGSVKRYEKFRKSSPMALDKGELF